VRERIPVVIVLLPVPDGLRMNPKLPFPYSYWAVPGRILAGCCPGSYDPGLINGQLTGLLDSGVTLVISLMEVAETELFQKFYYTYETVLPGLAKARGHAIRMERFPIPDRSIPTAEQMTSILQTIRKELDAGGVIYVHCLGGIGRTGTVIGCYFVEEGCPNPLEHLQMLTESEKDYFWPTPQTGEQARFVEDWKERTRSNC